MQWKEGKVYLEQEKRGWGCSLTFREFTLKSATGICLPLASVASSSSESVHHVCVIWPRIDLGQRKVLTDNQPKLICLLSAMFSVPLTVRLPVRCWIISFSWKVTFPSLLKLAVSVENPKKGKSWKYSCSMRHCCARFSLGLSQYTSADLNNNLTWGQAKKNLVLRHRVTG